MKLTLNTHHHDVLNCSIIIAWSSFIQLTHPGLFHLILERGIRTVTFPHLLQSCNLYLCLACQDEFEGMNMFMT